MVQRNVTRRTVNGPSRSEIRPESIYCYRIRVVIVKPDYNRDQPVGNPFANITGSVIGFPTTLNCSNPRVTPRRASTTSNLGFVKLGPVRREHQGSPPSLASPSLGPPPRRSPLLLRLLAVQICPLFDFLGKPWWRRRRRRPTGASPSRSELLCAVVEEEKKKAYWSLAGGNLDLLSDSSESTLVSCRASASGSPFPLVATERSRGCPSPSPLGLLRPQEEAASSGWSMLRQASMLLLLYLALGTVAYSFNRHHFSGEETHPVVDSLYFCIVTLCTIGYGDITPLTPAAKVLSCIFVLVGFGFLDILLSGAVNYTLDIQEGIIIAAARGGAVASGYVFDAEKGRMRIRTKVGLALGVVVLCIGVGSLVLFLVEKMDWMDSFYLSVMSVTTVGYGDKAFKTLPGRLFASVWLLVSTLAVARSFLFLAEARIDKRQRRIAKWVLQRDMTVEDLVAADLNNTGFISKSEYVVFKLKEMGKIGEKDILQICNQFKKLDPNNSGKITLPNLLNINR